LINFLSIPFVLVQTPVNQTNLTESITYAKHCGGISSYTQWIYYISAPAIYMQINTINFSFNSTPLYYTSIIGNSVRSDFTGYDAIYSASITYLLSTFDLIAAWLVHRSLITVKLINGILVGLVFTIENILFYTCNYFLFFFIVLKLIHLFLNKYN